MDVYEELVARLGDGFPDCTVSAFPDGSVDYFCTVRDGDEWVRERRRFAAAVAAGRDSFDLRIERTEPGGQSVNAAIQADELGSDVTLVGHLDHDRLQFPFRTASMGRPSEVMVIRFGADDLMLAAESAAMREWTFADLRVAAPDGVETFLAADVVWCGNWATMPNMSAALAEVASLDVDGGTFLLDPGPIVGVSDSRLRRLVDAVAALGDAYSAILSINDDESTRLSAVADGELDRSKRLRELHDRTGAAVVEHGLDAALAATDEGVVRVPNLAVESVVSDTGGGDRFGAGLALARDAGWEWPLALGLGNACASYYVETGETGSASDLAAHLTDGELVG
jgi:sugar/nucleoside kinase (ribokinase family)